jgi:Ni/Fe-hydrogenase subunit HybB-like protein
MGTMPLILATFLYLWQSYSYHTKIRVGMMLTFIGYSVANIGLIIDFYEQMDK